MLGPADTRYPPGDIEKIKNYLYNLYAGNAKRLNEAKVLLVGEGDVGKTSLVKCLIGEAFDANERKTDGINIKPWPVEARGETVKLNTWDFGGQEIMHATHQFFLTKRSLYLLVLNARISDEDNRIEDWLKTIQNFGDDSPVIIVGNKVDQQRLDIDQRGLRKKYSIIKDIIETSCETEEGIEKLKSKIAEEIGALEDVFNLFPNNWMEIKERLETMEEDYIQYERYETLCDQAGVEDEESQSTLISFLHKLGIVVQTHQYAYEKIWWRSGVVLQWQGNRALIKSDKEESIISIWVDGAPATRRDFLYALRLTFDSIYRTIPGLSVTHAEESLNMAAIAYCTATLIFFE